MTRLDRILLTVSMINFGVGAALWFKRHGLWQAQYTIHRRQVHVGYFATPEAAHEARTAAIRQAHGAFARSE